MLILNCCLPWRWLPILSSIILSFQVSAQQFESPIAELSLRLIGGQGSALEFARDYPLQMDEVALTSEASPLFAARIGYSRFFQRNGRLMWDFGLEAGLDSYQFKLLATEDFVDLDWDQPFNDQFTEFDLFYAAALAGLKYRLPLSPRSSISLNAGARFTYYFRSYIELGVGAILDSGQAITIFSTEMESNVNGRMIIAPELGLDYYYVIPGSRFSITAGVNTSVSRSNYLEGEYQLNGDDELLQGSFTKSALFLGIQLGVVYRL